MWRSLGAGLCAVVLTGCVDCQDRYVYHCELRYHPFHGYYQYCYPIRNQCPAHHQRCSGNDCDDDDRSVACKRNDDCELGQVCDATGSCVKSTNGNAGAAGPGRPPADEPDGGTSVSTDADVSGAGGAPAWSGAGGAVGIGGMSGGQSPAERVRHLSFPCIRDTQCGAGQCLDGDCYAACETDTDCGTADRCSVETGRRLCMPDPNPPVRCDQSSECRPEQSCLDGACHDPCDVDTDCADPQDRCLFNLCVPDRRPIAECVLNLECASGFVCLDGRCVVLGGEADGGVP